MKLIALLLFLLLPCCVADDFNNLAEGFAPLTPHDAAIMASNQYDSNSRRQGMSGMTGANWWKMLAVVCLLSNQIMNIQHTNTKLVGGTR